MTNFKEALDLCSLSNMPYQGDKFTLANNRQGNSFTKENLDKVLSNPS